MPVLALAGCIWFCIYYLTHTHTHLLADFRQAHGCFYRSDSFAEAYFSEATKAAGNKWCIAGLAASGLGLAALGFAASKKAGLRYSAVLLRKDLAAVLLLWGLAGVGWLWGMLRALPAYDEVFSAINIAGEGPALAVQYYMLPNNHTLFNILNALLPGNGGDKVLTGRILSGVFHLGTLAALYSWLRSRQLPTAAAFGFAAVWLLFYPVWAFSFQARGYSLYLFCCWTALVSLDAYFRKKEHLFLLLHLIAGFTGFAVMPAYLYWQLGIVVYALLLSFLYKADGQLFRKWLWVQAPLGMAVFLFYLPGIAISGLPAYTQNPYVTPFEGSFPEYTQVLLAAVNSTVRYSFASDIDGESLVYPIAFFLPLVAWPFCRSETGRRAVLQLVVFGAVFAFMQLFVTRRWPFMRNMIAHVSLFAVVFPLCFYDAVRGISLRLRLRPFLPALATALLLLLTAVHYLRFMRDHLNDLYYNDLVRSYKGPAQLVASVPADGRVWYSDESFFPHFLLRQKNISASHCTGGDDYNFFILDHRSEALPAHFQSVPVQEVFKNEQYVLYKRK